MDEHSLRRLRADFPILNTRIGQQPLIYFDNAATTHKPRAVIDAVTHFYRRQNSNVHRAAHTLAADATLAYETAREKLAAWLGVSRDSVIWTRGATEAINLVAQAWLAPRLRPGDRILLALTNHHANILPWQQVAQAQGAVLDVVGLTESGDLDTEQYTRLLERQPKLVALSQVSNALGTLYPVSELVSQARSAGAWTLIDGAQALPHFDTNLSQLECDFYVFSGHKLFGPTGIGALYGRYDLLEQMSPWQTGGEMIEQVSFEQSRFAPPPLRFEAGTPNIAGALGLGAAIDYLNSQDRKALERHEQLLLSRLIDGLASLPAVRTLPSGSKRVSLLSCTISGEQVQDVAALLDSRGIAVRAGHHCAQPLMHHLGVDASLRVSMAFYNTEAEVQTLLETLDQALQPTQVSTQGSLELSLSQVKSAQNWPERFSALMALANNLPPAPEALHQPQWEVKGCATRTWMRIKVTASDRIELDTDADSKLMRGLLYLIAARVNGQLRASIDADQIREELVEMGFENQLSQTRGNALRILIEHLRSLIDTKPDSALKS